MMSIPTRSAKRKQADIPAAETDSETSRSSTNDAISTDSESISQATNQTDVDSDSDLSTSSEEPSSESDDSSGSDSDSDNASDNASDTTQRASTQDSEVITNLRPGTKPNMKLGTTNGGLLQRLKAFVLEIAAANQELDKERLDGTIERRNIERVENGDGPFIELDLGLGVLEEKSGDITTSQQDPDSASESGSDEKYPDIISQLMGQVKKDRKAGQIQEIRE
ncbi:hypothetical protein E2P81_ATG05724 [Venturia nashicola]|nr:hypothetical protein E2P81_ATG05724 [Venturia nashicola]